MRILRPLLFRLRAAFSVRRVGGALLEAAILASAVAALETYGRFAPGDGADLVGLALAGAVAVALRPLARAGRLPTSTAVIKRAIQGAAGIGRRLSPRYAVALRLSPRMDTRPDRTLVGVLFALALALDLLLAFGEHVVPALRVLRGFSYSVFLGAMAVVWGVLGGTVVLGALASAQWVREAPGVRSGRSRVRVLLLAAAWIAGIAAAVHVPGIVLVGAALALGAWHAFRFSLASPPTVHLCRRDEQGMLRTVPVHRYLSRLHLTMVLALAAASALGEGQRLWTASSVGGDFAFTGSLGLLASLCAVFLVARVGAQLGTVLRTGADLPARRLERTLWIPGEGPETAWSLAARGAGWRVGTARRPPRGGFDLMVGRDRHPQAFVPDPDLEPKDQAFRLERRFHVVKRREFFRRFHTLHKEATSGDPPPGTGFLFCPHVWVVPGLVRDVDGEGDALSGGLAGPPVLGRPYAEAFPVRLRRYLAMVLGDLEIDIVYWEDAVSWADLRRVFGVAFECWDQGRLPLDARHFQGLPRIRVLIHEETPERAAWEEGPHEVDAGLPPATHARILIVLRDRGGSDADVTPETSDTWRRAPIAV